MKTTIKLDQGRALVILPGVLGTTRIDLTMLGVGVGGGNLTPDQAGALMVALERVAEHHDATQKRKQHGACPFQSECDLRIECSGKCNTKREGAQA